MRIAILTFDGFNEIDSCVAAHMLNRLRERGWQAQITAPQATLTSMNGVRIQAQQPLEFARGADAVLIGSGRRTREIIEDRAILARLHLDPHRQLVASQCTGALLLARLGLLQPGLPVCTDAGTRSDLQRADIQVLDQPFIAHDNIATAGGCLAAQYLASWVAWRLGGRGCVEQIADYVAPTGEREAWLQRALAAIGAAAADGLEILPFHPVHREHFKRLNLAWLERYFEVEPIDEQVLGNPESALLEGGGAILFARLEGRIVGTVALKREDAATFELTKMAVDEGWQGRGVGRRLLEHACRLARARGARRVLLYSHRSLAAALALYRAQGFIEQPLDSDRYVRSNIKMLRAL